MDAIMFIVTFALGAIVVVVAIVALFKRVAEGAGTLVFGGFKLSGTSASTVFLLVGVTLMLSGANGHRSLDRNRALTVQNDSLATTSTALKAAIEVLPATVGRPKQFENALKARISPTQLLELKRIQPQLFRVNVVPVVPTFDHTKTYVIRSVRTGKVLDVAGESHENGAPINQYDSHGRANQQWRFEPVGQAGLYMVKSVLSGKCLDVTASGVQDGDPIVQWDCHGRDNQVWRLRPKQSGQFVIESKGSQKVLDVPGGSGQSGLQIQQWRYEENNQNQLWRIEVIGG